MNYYSENDIATYINFCELLGQTYEGLSDDEFEAVVIKALQEIGINVSDRKKLFESCKYWLEDQCIDLENYPGYVLEYEGFEKHFYQKYG